MRADLIRNSQNDAAFRSESFCCFKLLDIVGVVVEIDYEVEYFQDYVYTILCLDGVKRFFIESELIKL